MKSAHLLSEDFDLFDVVSDELLAVGGVGTADVAQVTGSHGYMFSFFAREEPEGDLLDEVRPAAPDVAVPDLHGVAFYCIECRSEQYFAEMVRTVAGLTSARSWVMDSNGVIWWASTVDPGRVVL